MLWGNPVTLERPLWWCSCQQLQLRSQLTARTNLHTREWRHLWMIPASSIWAKLSHLSLLIGGPRHRKADKPPLLCPVWIPDPRNREHNKMVVLQHRVCYAAISNEDWTSPSVSSSRTENFLVFLFTGLWDHPYSVLLTKYHLGLLLWTRLIHADIRLDTITSEKCFERPLYKWTMAIPSIKAKLWPTACRNLPRTRVFS